MKMTETKAMENTKTSSQNFPGWFHLRNKTNIQLKITAIFQTLSVNLGFKLRIINTNHTTRQEI